MDWCKSDSLKLIELYRQHEYLWNPTHDHYKNKTKRHNAWNNMSDAMKCDLTEVKKKMESLLGSFRRERQKLDNSVKTGGGADAVYTSTWFAFKDMLFLLDKFTPRETKNIEAQSDESTDVDQEFNESEFNSAQQAASTSIQLPEPKAPEVATPKRKLVHESINSPIAHICKKRVTANIPKTRSEEAYQILKDTVANRNLRDGSTIYGEHVASKHRKYSTHTQSVVEHLIGNILFKADMGKYEPVDGPSVSPLLHSSIVKRSFSTCSDNCSSNEPPSPSSL